MSKHVVSIETPDTLNQCILRVVDTSIYSDKVPVECATLEVLLPGFTCASSLDATAGFCNWNITACDLGIQTTNCGTTFDILPDGVYVLKYSIAPNEYVYAEYNHLRITNALLKYQDILCELDLSSCEPSAVVQDKLHKLRMIKMMLDAAKAAVEFCHNPSRGMDIYEYAYKQLDKMACTVCV
ncbi:MAG: hypothetical protein ACXADH_07635 [Candidatus Kariarchaeaceae archaeon]|jgi:hypothetical protein